jgi:hypothetical protein
MRLKMGLQTCLRTRLRTLFQESRPNSSSIMRQNSDNNARRLSDEKIGSLAIMREKLYNEFVADMSKINVIKPFATC